MDAASIQLLGPREIAAATPWLRLIDEVIAAYRQPIDEPMRQVSDVIDSATGRRSVMIMPSWTGQGDVGVKLLTVSEGDCKRGHETIAGLYVYFDPASGQPVAILDAEELTARRTAAVAAAATARLAPVTAASLLIVGAGRLSRPMAEAICTVRKIDRVRIWGRTPARAQMVAESLAVSLSARVEAVHDLAAAASEADIICTLTPSREPLVLNDWVRPDAHINLVGAFRPDMRESEGAMLRRADCIFVDNPKAAMTEAGDIVQAVAEGHLIAAEVRAFADLLARREQARSGFGGLTLFKSVGSARQDLAAARLCWLGHQLAAGR